MRRGDDDLGGIPERWHPSRTQRELRASSQDVQGMVRGVVWSYCVRDLGHTLHAREFPLGLFHGRSLHVPVSGTPFPVPNYPRSSIVLPTVDDRIIVHHNGLFNLNLHTQVASARLGFILPAVELCPHGVRDVARGGELMTDDDPLMSTLLSGVCGWGKMISDWSTV